MTHVFTYRDRDPLPALTKRGPSRPASKEQTMATQIFSTDDPHANEKAAHAAWMADQTQTVLYDDAERYAVGHLGAMEEDIEHFMTPDTWEWREVEQEFYDPKYWEREL